MDFGYSEEQRMLSDSVVRLFAGKETDVWAACCQMGLAGALVPEEFDGMGGLGIDGMVAALEIGRNLAVIPFLSTAAVGMQAVNLTGSKAQKAKWLPQIAEGHLQVSIAFEEPGARYDLDHLETQAVGDGDGYILNGRKSVVLGGDLADLIIVAARLDNGVKLFALDAGAAGITRTDYALTDGRGAADIALHDVRLQGDALLGDGAAVMAAVYDLGAAMIAAEALGALEKIIAMTAEYLKTRHQFGQPISNFQVLQHQMADMAVAFEHMKSLVFEACDLAMSKDAVSRAQAVSAAKILIAEEGRQICQHAIQMHGGIGVTDEYDLGRFVKRVTVAEFAFGDADHHIARYGKHLADTADD